VATLERNSIYTTLQRNLDYIKSSHSTISKERLFAIGRYIEGDHANILYAQGHGCSKIPELAAEQMLFDRDEYWRRKKGKKLQGQTEKKKEVLAEHFYISFHQCDNVDVETAMQIANEWLQRTGLDQYKALMAPHINTDELHVHISVCAYRVDGKRKISINNAKMDALRKQLDYICVEHGLSIIANQRLLIDPEYKAWYESVVASNKIIIHSPRTHKKVVADRKKREERKARPETKKITIENEVEKEFFSCMYRSQQAEESRKERATRYYGGNKYRMHSVPNRYYSVHLYDNNGRKRSLLELVFMLISVVFFGAVYHDRNGTSKGRYSYDSIGTIDKRIQRLSDTIRLAREYDVNKPSKIDDRIKACGGDMNSLKKQNYRLQKIVDNSSSEKERAEAAAQIESNNAVLKDLGRDYHNLKRLQADYVYCTSPGYTMQLYSTTHNKPQPQKSQPKNNEPKPQYNKPESQNNKSEYKSNKLKLQKEKAALQGVSEGRKPDIMDMIHSAAERSSQNRKYDSTERLHKKDTLEH